MTKSFNCASCSAPLEFEGTTMQKCRYCGSTVIAPPEMFYASSASPFGDFSSLSGMALKIAEIDQLIHNGKKIDAIKVFRETFGVGLAEAKDAVEKMERGESVDISSMRVKTSRPMTAQEIDAVKKIGFTIGGSVLVTVLASVLIIGGVVAAILFITWTAVSKIPTVSNSASKTIESPPVAKPTPNPDITELLKIGGEGNGAGRFKDNRHVAVDGKGRIYSSDYSPFRIQVFDANGEFVNQWTAESGTNLYDLAADRDGNLYLANDKGIFKFEGETGKLVSKTDGVYVNGMTLTWDHKIVAVSGRTMTILDADLKQLVQIKDAGERANSSSGFSNVAADGEGFIYAIDNHSDEICKFSPDGKFLNRFTSHANSPNGIAVDPKGRIFVADSSHIKVLDTSGNLLRDLKSYQAFGLAFDAKGDLFVAACPYVIKYSLAF